MESRWEVRRLAPSTKLALANALKKLLQKKFLDDITVKELVEECEVNRQTFYYHFQDIYDLLRWFLEHETSEALRGCRISSSVRSICSQIPLSSSFAKATPIPTTISGSSRIRKLAS